MQLLRLEHAKERADEIAKAEAEEGAKAEAASARAKLEEELAKVAPAH